MGVEVHLGDARGDAMLVREVMTHRAETIGPDETLEEAARRMRETGVGALAVCEQDRLIGFLTDRDIVVRSTAAGQVPGAVAVRSAMTPQVVWCSEDDPLTDAAEIMERMAVRRIAVMNAEKRLVGLLSVDDVALFSRTLAGEVVEHLRAPERPVEHGPWPWWE
jgi:CBS domain-containing protein